MTNGASQSFGKTDKWAGVPHRRFAVALALTAWLLCSMPAWAGQRVWVVVSEPASPRAGLGVERLVGTLAEVGFEPVRGGARPGPAEEPVIVVGSPGLGGNAPAAEEGFILATPSPNLISVVGGDDTGTLYGCLELAGRVRAVKAIPQDLDVNESPAFKLRGPCIGMQRPALARDGVLYDYLYTPEEFPFFYDKGHWSEYLDFLLANRMNVLYLWNGHPFTSLLELLRYPDARELSDKQLRRNIEMFTWLTTEADKRGIWVVQMFYNIHLSHALARARNVPFVHQEPSKLTRDYTRYCISEFVRTYPHVGLMFCLGEALKDEYDRQWLCDVIIPGVQDAMKELGTDREPPIIVRAHSTPIEEVMKAGTRLYGNLYTMHKYNGEVLAHRTLRGDARRLHESLAKLGSAHIVNVHLLGNLEPFRWGSPAFIRDCMQTCRQMGAKGLHLYPLRYWDWPITADKTTPPIRQIDRDWLWFEAWGRYAWNPDRDATRERTYWVGRLADRFGSSEAAEKILDAYEASGECAPRLIRRFGITHGNRQCLALGMRMTHLIHPGRHQPYAELWESMAPPGERLDEYVRREWAGEPHQGETPPKVIEDVLRYAQQARDAADAAKGLVTKRRNEAARLCLDMVAIQTMCKYYAAKVKAAEHVLHYGYSGRTLDLAQALFSLEESLDIYRRLTMLTEYTYRDGCSLHIPWRSIPFVAGSDAYIHWRQCLPEFEKELESFRGNLEQLAKEQKTAEPATTQPASAEGLTEECLTELEQLFEPTSQTQPASQAPDD